ncbi:uncharacterized protein LOC134298220 [Anolis carolinensis]|uniref:uncharacterized protein LOC134298220 n=1 Tax=Anolis carolinensis TaxID=28377 RepID=UPI002F2B6730
MSMQFQDDTDGIPPSEAESRNERPQRIKHPSAKMLAHLIGEKELLHVRLGSAWERIVTLMDRIESLGITRVPSILQTDLEETFGLWRGLVSKIVQVLERINAKDSELEIVSVLADTNEKENKVRAILDALEFSSPSVNLRSEPKGNQSSLCSHETNLLKSPAVALSLKSNRSSQVSKLRECASSKHSHSSKSSAAGSAISSLAALHIKETARLELKSKVAGAEADAKAADLTLPFKEEEQRLQIEQARRQSEMQIEQARRQSEMQMEQAQRQGEIEMLRIRMDATAKKVRAETLAKALIEPLTEENVSQLPKQDPSSKVLVHLNSLNSQFSDEEQEDFSPYPEQGPKVTFEFPAEQSVIAGSSPLPELPVPPAKSLGQSIRASRPSASWPLQTAAQGATDSSVVDVIPPRGQRLTQGARWESTPQQQTPQLFPSTPESQLVSIIRSPRRDLKDKGVEKFSDKPEEFLLWKATFQRAIRDLKLLPEEELTLLAAWLGPASSSQVKKIYAAHVADPDKALEKAWARLQQRYGASTEIEASLMDKLQRFPALKLKDFKLLWDLSDLLTELESAKENPELPGLKCLDQHLSQRQILTKLPFTLQERWGQEVFNYKEAHSQAYPPFSHLVQFITRAARERNDPQTGLPTLYQGTQPEKAPKVEKKPSREAKRPVSVKAVETQHRANESKSEVKEVLCPIHQKPHSLANCREFGKKPYKERQQIVQKLGICFRCCGATPHFASNCKEDIKCARCNSLKHCTAMHNSDAASRAKGDTSSKEGSSTEATNMQTASRMQEDAPSVACTELCSDVHQFRVCHPICLADVYPARRPWLKKRLYVALDSQSDASLATPEFFQLFDIKTQTVDYTMSTCVGKKKLQGRIASGFVVSSCDQKRLFELPDLIECSSIPRNKRQIVTREVVEAHPHLRKLKNALPAFRPDVDIALLLGADCPNLFYVNDQVKGPPGAPIAQLLPLGWTVTGPVCINRMHPPSSVGTRQAHVLQGSRPTLMHSCLSHISVYCQGITPEYSSIFEVSERDEITALSKDEQRFLEIMNSQVSRSPEGNWIAPLPFKAEKPTLPNNRHVAENRLWSLKKKMQKDPKVYVANRINNILSSSTPSQWHHVATSDNPADIASRGASTQRVLSSSWLTGPRCLTKVNFPSAFSPTDNTELPESVPEVKVCKMTTEIKMGQRSCLEPHRFECFSEWHSLLRAVARLIHRLACKDSEPLQVQDMIKAKSVIFKSVQRSAFKQEIARLEQGLNIPNQSLLNELNPFLDKEGILRVGGRLAKAKLKACIKNPIIIPPNSHTALLLVRHHHERIHHQGRTLTEAALRNEGLWVVNAKRLVNSCIFKCVKCRRLRRNCQSQLMAELPQDRTLTDPPFSHVGIDVFGPWEVVTRKTRGGVVNNKRWAVLFTCLVIRAVHIEVIEGMDTSSFLNALKRFIALRRPIKSIRSDCGTNFVGATKELNCVSRFGRDPKVQNFTNTEQIMWTFNVPHASHMDGVWERMIGISRKILNAMLLSHRSLTHDVLVTLMAEVTAIINNRPLVPLTSDPENLQPLTPALILTQKVPGWKDIMLPVPDGTHRALWKQVQSLANHFWKRWKAEYLSQLQARRIWQSPQDNIEVNNVVLLKDKDLPRHAWPMGIVLKTFPCPDGKVRKVQLKTCNRDKVSILDRPISDLVLLIGDV